MAATAARASGVAEASDPAAVRHQRGALVATHPPWRIRAASLGSLPKPDPRSYAAREHALARRARAAYQRGAQVPSAQRIPRPARVVARGPRLRWSSAMRGEQGLPAARPLLPPCPVCVPAPERGPGQCCRAPAPPRILSVPPSFPARTLARHSPRLPRVPMPPRPPAPRAMGRALVNAIGPRTTRGTKMFGTTNFEAHRGGQPTLASTAVAPAVLCAGSSYQRPQS